VFNSFHLAIAKITLRGVDHPKFKHSFFTENVPLQYSVFEELVPWHMDKFSNIYEWVIVSDVKDFELLKICIWKLSRGLKILKNFTYHFDSNNVMTTKL